MGVKMADLPKAKRPYMTVVLAMSADGKIADVGRSPARFGSAQDKSHLETQIAQADGVLFGAGTLRAYGTTLRVTNGDLLRQRQERGQPSQPVQMVCSRSADLDGDYAFFRQPVPRWLVTTGVQVGRWGEPQFERVVAVGYQEVDWEGALLELWRLGLERVVVTGGGELVASLWAIGAIDEMWLTVCPVVLGGRDAPTPVGGAGLLDGKLELLGVEAIGGEVFLHYRSA
jgi:5-amino-6-(5-phosphoribosylamino)uracil reductase